MTGDVLGEDKVVLRVLRHKQTKFVPEGARLPTIDGFHPSQDDKDEAAANNHAIRLSVWDWDLTTVEQATAFRRLPEDDPQSYAFSLSVGAVVAMAAQHRNARARAVHCPLPPSDGPGAEGHSGLEGCDRPTNTPRPAMKAFLADLCDLCVDVSKQSGRRRP